MCTHLSFEQGPIRPPSEAASLLLRFTRNCPWNKCAFCPVYKGRKFSRRSKEEIKKDIDTVRAILDDLKALSWSQGQGGKISRPLISQVLASPTLSEQYKHVALWRYQGQGTVFLQDANSLLLKTRELVELLGYLRKQIPGITRITSYGRSSTLARKSLAELTSLKKAGLDRIHIGLESGSDQVLKMVKKGCTAEQHIQAGQKVVQAGLTLSEYIMPGLGGTVLSTEHALETARVLNAINPHFIRLRTLHVVPGTELFDKLRTKEFQKPAEDDLVHEIRLLIEHLECTQTTLTSDHIMNLLEEVQGTLPEDKKSMLKTIDQYLELSPEDRLLFRLGRRGGALRSVKEIFSPQTREQLIRAKNELLSGRDKDLDEIITELGNQYI